MPCTDTDGVNMKTYLSCVALVLGLRGKNDSKQGRKEVQGKTEEGVSEVRRQSG